MMKKKTFFHIGVILAVMTASLTVFAGAVHTKDKPKEDGGYYGGQYHLKGKKDRKPYVNRKQNMKNPFSGFTKKSGKPKKQGEMPHSK